MPILLTGSVGNQQLQLGPSPMQCRAWKGLRMSDEELMNMSDEDYTAWRRRQIKIAFGLSAGAFVLSMVALALAMQAAPGCG